MALEYITGLMVLNIQENGFKMKCADLVSLSGLMDVSSKVNLRMEWCMEKVYTLGKMEENTKVCINM